MRQIFLMAFLLVTACATSQQKISQNIGCPAEETRIIETDPGFGVENTTYRAACGEQQYTCSTGTYMGKFNWLEDMKCNNTPKGAPGYLTQEQLAIERKSGFDAFLEDLVAPPDPKSGFTPEIMKQ